MEPEVSNIPTVISSAKPPGPRDYPNIEETIANESESISFVVIQFSDDYYHNILRSPCVHDLHNQLVTIDNRHGHRFDNLSEAINQGLQATIHDLICVVHEDVLLVAGWQACMLRSLAELDIVDHDWGIAGSVGWTESGDVVGHWSDPHNYCNTLDNKKYAPVHYLDEQILIFRRNAGFLFDPFIPSIHNIGLDISLSLKKIKKKTYAINAPTIHKYANERGQLIADASDSPKIQARYHPANHAERRCSDEYLKTKWPEIFTEDLEVEFDPIDSSNAAIDAPIILLSRGGSGSRLLSLLARDLGIFLGNEVNDSGDTMEMVDAVYRAVLGSLQRRADWQRAKIVPRLQSSAAAMLERRGSTGPWAIKLPESMLILPLLNQAFPDAKYVHQIRDPLATCLRRSHMTARFDNAIGRASIRSAYLHCGLPVTRCLEDCQTMHMAYTTRHQLETVRDFASTDLSSRYLEIKFENVIEKPTAATREVGLWLGIEPVTDNLGAAIDPDRASVNEVHYSAEQIESTKHALLSLRTELGYV